LKLPYFRLPVKPRKSLIIGDKSVMEECSILNVCSMMTTKVSIQFLELYSKVTIISFELNYLKFSPKAKWCLGHK